MWTWVGDIVGEHASTTYAVSQWGSPLFIFIFCVRPVFVIGFAGAALQSFLLMASCLAAARFCIIGCLK